METKASIKKHNMDLHSIKFKGHTLGWYKAWNSTPKCPDCGITPEFK